MHPFHRLPFPGELGRAGSDGPPGSEGIAGAHGTPVTTLEGQRRRPRGMGPFGVIGERGKKGARVDQLVSGVMGR